MRSLRAMMPRLFERFFGRPGRDFYTDLSEDQRCFHSVMIVGFRSRLFGWPGVDAELTKENLDGMLDFMRKRAARDRLLNRLMLSVFGESPDFHQYLAKEILEKDIRFIEKRAPNWNLGEGVSLDVYRDRHGIETLVPAYHELYPFTGRNKG